MARRPTDPRRQFGRDGEDLAARWLARRGYRILARNARFDRVEIDLIARRGATAVFVEVKTRSSRSHGRGEEAVDARKRARLVRGARAWLHAHGRGVRRARFDVIVCECDAGDWTVRHFEAAFDASD